ncbi:MAG: hypothetical protein WD020_05440 [Acidimicrobiia bacterium]
MNWLRRVSLGVLAVIVGTISTIAWVSLDTAVALVISLAAGGLIAVRAMLGGDSDETPS